jgi:hypothetical protein
MAGVVMDAAGHDILLRVRTVRTMLLAARESLRRGECLGHTSVPIADVQAILAKIMGALGEANA